MKSQKGFSLIELMTVAIIAGILAMIALPSYKNYVIRGKIPDATSNLAAKRVLLEQYFQDNRTYMGATAAGQGCYADSVASKYFTFSCQGVGAATYQIVATGTGSMAGFVYTIDQNNTKTSTITAADWAATSLNCWITKQGGQC